MIDTQQFEWFLAKKKKMKTKMLIMRMLMFAAQVLDREHNPYNPYQ